MLRSLLKRLPQWLIPRSMLQESSEHLGDRGEALAIRHLKGEGLRILDAQHKNAYGEVDIIALDKDCVVFVEVKTRSSTEAGRPLEAVDYRKQQRLTRIALAWLKKKRRLGKPARFDVISIVWADGAEPQLQHFRNAFEPIGKGQFFG